jgi:outer membrane protein TolC
MRNGWTRSCCFTAVLLGFGPFAAGAQISLSSAVDLALRNDPKVKLALADVEKAKAERAESRDVFIPSVTSTAGFGYSQGAPLALPVVFSIAAQSLVINFSQIDFVRAADAGLDAANYALLQAQSDVADDAITTYVDLDNAMQRKAALKQAADVAARLQQIVNDRYAAGADPHVEVTKAARTVAGIKLQALQLDNEIDALSSHLGRIMGLGRHVNTVHESIPNFDPVPDRQQDSAQEKQQENDGLKGAVALALSKEYTARGDARYRLLPQVAFGAGYSRIALTGTNYAEYYPAFNSITHPGLSLNSFDVGVQVSVPLLDMLHQSKAKAARAEAQHARVEIESQRMNFAEGHEKALNSARELAVRAEIASLDRDLAQDRIDTIELQLKADASAQEGGQPMTPKDEQNAKLDERLKYLDMLNADLQLRQTEITLMRQNGSISGWLHGMISSQPTTSPTPAVPSVTAPPPAGVSQPGVPGVPKP